MKGMVVAPEPLAAHAGVEAFRQGGNAADAAVAAAFTQGVVDPLMCGLGGTAFALVRGGRSAIVNAVCGSAMVGSVPPPEAFRNGYRARTETIGRYVVEGEINQLGYQSIMVPGFVRCMKVLYEQYGSGRVAWPDLLAPAIRLAEEGYEVYPYIGQFWASTEDRPGYPALARTLNQTPACAAVYLNNGRPWQEGERILQRDMATTLKRLAAEGPEDFYTGAIARRIAADFAANGALVTADDLRTFPVDVMQPVTGSFHDYEILSGPPPASGVQMIEMLQTLERFPLRKIGHNSADYIVTLAEVMIRSFLEQAVLKGDPPYSISMRTIRQGLSRGHAEAVAESVRSKSLVAGPGAGPALDGTTHISVADTDGTLVSLTHSTGSLGASGVVTPGLGFIYNNFLGHFHPLPGHPDSIIPGKRGGGGVPTIVLRDGKPCVVIGAPGGSRLISSILQCLLNTLDFGMGMAEAVTVPRFHAEEPGLIFAEPSIPAVVIADVTARGYRVVRSTYMSRVQALKLGDTAGEMEAGSDPRGGAGIGVFDS
jgi:gamma-glutamyltranspeptidase/glutathione hydrolase